MVFHHNLPNFTPSARHPASMSAGEHALTGIPCVVAADARLLRPSSWEDLTSVNRWILSKAEAVTRQSQMVAAYKSRDLTAQTAASLSNVCVNAI